MAIELKVPVLPESTPEATVAKWYKKPGDSFNQGDPLVDLETDKVMLEVPAMEDGRLERIVASEGATVKQDQVLGILVAEKVTASKIAQDQTTTDKSLPTQPQTSQPPVQSVPTLLNDLSPALRRLVVSNNIDLSLIKGSGKNGRVTKDDILSLMPLDHTLSSQQLNDASSTQQACSSQQAASKELATPSNNKFTTDTTFAPAVLRGERFEQRVPMTRLRATIAKRLMGVKQSTAMLTTFNEVNMQPVMDLRTRYRDQFEKTHGVKLGFMSFFVKATVAALKRFPVINASMDGNEIVYHGYFDIGIAVSSPRGLVVPVLRQAETMSMVDIEKAILDYAAKAKTGKLSMEDITGGTFTITNGGVFGSMLSTPILNPPQSAILGMHNIVKRPVVEGDAIVVRPVMYLALSYDHRLIDGSDAVRFLVAIKSLLEDPARLLLDV